MRGRPRSMGLRGRRWTAIPSRGSPATEWLAPETPTATFVRRHWQWPATTCARLPGDGRRARCARPNTPRWSGADSASYFDIVMAAIVGLIIALAAVIALGSAFGSF